MLKKLSISERFYFEERRILLNLKFADRKELSWAHPFILRGLMLRNAVLREAKELSNWKTCLVWKGWRFFAIAYSEKDEILHSADAPFRMTEKKRVRMTLFVTIRINLILSADTEKKEGHSWHFVSPFFYLSPFFLPVTLRRSRRVSFGDSSPSLKLRVRMTEKNAQALSWAKALSQSPEPKPWAKALSQSPEPKPWAEALSRSPEPKPWAEALSRSPELMRRVCEGSAKGLRRVHKITRKDIPIGNFK